MEGRFVPARVTPAAVVNGLDEKNALSASRTDSLTSRTTARVSCFFHQPYGPDLISVLTFLVTLASYKKKNTLSRYLGKYTLLKYDNRFCPDCSCHVYVTGL
jgi:hypothetical protein